MRKTSLVVPLSVVFALLMFSSCQKEGSTGPTGPAGPAGPAGSQGPKGDAGTANVIYSEWLDVEYVPSIDEVSGDTTGYSAEIPAPKLTDDILATGDIKVYVNFNTAAEPTVLPIPFFNGNFIINPIFVSGSIGLISNGDFSTFLDGTDKIFQYRYVIIPGGVLAAKPNDVKLDTYAQVKKYFNIKN